MSRFIAPTFLAVSCTLAAYLAFSATGNAAPRETIESPRLIRELHQAAQEGYESSLKLYQIGRVDSEHVYRWSRRLMEVESRAAENHDQLLASAAEHSARMEELLEVVETKLATNATTVLEVDGFAVKYYVIEGQILLAEIGAAQQEGPDRRKKN